MGSLFDEVSSEALSEYENFESIPDKLWHYTSADGLLGIANSNSLRFSDTAFVNDGSELIHGFQLLKKTLDAFAHRVVDEHKHVVDQVVDTTERFLNSRGAVVFCMSDDPNLLNQWRDYGADVVPYCIGLSTKKLQNYRDFNFTTYLCKVIYSLSAQEEMLNRLVEAIYTKAKEIPGFGSLEEDEARPHLTDAAYQFAKLIVKFKNPAFEAEREWRLISHFPHVIEQTEPGYRTSNLGIVPYYEYKPIADGVLLPITDIVVGPSKYSQVSRAAIEGFFEQKGYDSVDYHHSLIPWRR